MRLNLNLVKKSAIISFGIILAACTSEVYDPTPNPGPDPGPGVVPGTGDTEKYTNSNSVALTVNVADQYDGKYYYTVEVFNDDPVANPDAKLITGSGQKTNSKVPYNVNFNVPAESGIVYICVTDPFKNKRYYTKEVAKNMTLDLLNTTTKSMSMATSLRSDVPALPTDLNWDYTGAETLTDGSVFDRNNSSKNFYVPAGTTVSISKFSEWGNVKIRLYVAGTVNITSKNLTLYNDGCGIVVLNGGKLTSDKITFNNQTELLVADGGSVVSSHLFLNNNKARLYNSGVVNVSEFKASNASKVYNLKEFSAPKWMEFSASAYVYNTGAITTPKFTTAASVTIDNYGTVENDNLFMNTQTTINNHGKYTVKVLSHQGNPVINNYCAFYINDKVAFNGFEMNLLESSYLYAKTVTGRGLKVNMKESSMFDSESVTQENDFVLTGPRPSSDALFNAKALVFKGKASLNYATIAYWANHKEPDWNAITYNGVDLCGGASILYIPKGECNETGNGKQTTPENPDTDEEYEEDATLTYTYMFEDNWPAQGDYDMNDMVLNIQLMNKKAGNKVTGFKVNYVLYAVGATKQLDAAFQLDGVPASAFSGAESGQTYAVAELFRDAHSQLGVSQKIQVNTFSVTTGPASAEKAYTFSSALDQPVTAANFNLFIVWGGMDANPRNEIHLPHFRGTDKAAKNENSVSFLSDDKWMWAIAVPTSEFASYPKETIRIDAAYPGFGRWLMGEDTPDWYNVTDDNKDKVISFVD